MLSPTRRPIVNLSLDAPDSGKTVEIAPGLLWMRVPLNMRPDHINVYLFEDDDGWTVLDTGLNDSLSRGAWESVFANELASRPVKRVIGSHYHTDHIGLAGWLVERCGAGFYMTQTEYLLTRCFQSMVDDASLARHKAFLLTCGVADDVATTIARNRVARSGRSSPIPRTFNRLRAGDSLRLAGRDWTIFTSGGHAVEQLMLYCAADRLFVAMDHVLGNIVPMLTVGALAPNDDPVGDFLVTRPQLEAAISDDVVVLPGHYQPFQGLHLRLAQLQESYEARCDGIAAACRARPMSAVDLVPTLFKRNFSPEVTASTSGEVLAYVNFLIRRGDLVAIDGEDGVTRYRHA